MPVERSKKTINAWAKFLATPEGQEGLEWLSEQRPTTKIYDGPHILNYSAGQVDWHFRFMDMLKKELPSHPPPPVKEEDERLLPNNP